MKIKNSLLYGLSAACILPALLPLFHPGLFDRIDGFLYVSRFFEFHHVLRDGQFPPMWAPDYDAGYGNPIFLFYSPLFFIFAEAPRLLGLSYDMCVKVVVILSLVSSGVTMFIFAREFWGKAGAFLSAVSYVYTPYHLVDVYARAAFSENMAFTWFPLILWSFHKLIKEKKMIYLGCGSFSLAALVLSHNIMTMFFVPLLVLYIIFLLALNRDSRACAYSLLSFLLGLGLSAFFLLPVIFEKKYVILTRFLTGYFEYHKHFLSLGNFFFSDPKNPLYDVPLSFQIGPIGIVLTIMAIAIALNRTSDKQFREARGLLVFFLSLVPLYIFLMLPASKWIWQAVPLLQFAQFPWRLSALIVLSLSFAAGAAALFFQQEKEPWNKAITMAVLGLLLIISTAGYRKVPGYAPPLPDEYISPETIRTTESKIRKWDDIEKDPTDYRPRWVHKLTRRIIADKDRLEILSGDVKILDSRLRTSNYYFLLTGQEPSVARVNTFWFPGWKAFLDGEEIPIDKSNEYGLMDIRLPAGTHKLHVDLTDTPLRRTAKIISAGCFLLLCFLLFPRGKEPYAGT